VLRGAFVLGGAELLARFEWVVYVFGAVLIYGGVRLLRGGDERDPEKAPSLARCDATCPRRAA
jgi:tellurite resistance protein TerC